ncbi:MAG: hypothetical protein IH946_02515 [Bacteroidetes bacterium]|nr:hypothetical protein [Bacteroidota bacterium]
MASTLSWLDYSPEQDENLRKFIAAMIEGGLDYLGFQTINDRFSERFFPGITTVLTRAKYYLLLPSIYRQVEEKRLHGGNASQGGYDLEDLVRNMLYRDNPNADGLIGKEAGKDIVNHPSNIYWGSLRTLGIFVSDYNLSRWQYLKSLQSYYAILEENSDGRKHEDEQSGNKPNWDPMLKIDYRINQTGKLALNLSDNEADYLQSVFIRHAKSNSGSLIGYMLENPDAVPAEANWILFRKKIKSLVPENKTLQWEVEIAYRFKLLAAVIDQVYLYHLTIHKFDDKRREPGVRNALEKKLSNPELKILTKDPKWLNDIAKGKDFEFLNGSLKEILATDFDPSKIIKHKTLKSRIVLREKRKGHKARFHNERALKEWNPRTLESGELDYRLGKGFSIYKEIIDAKL